MPLYVLFSLIIAFSHFVGRPRNRGGTSNTSQARAKAAVKAFDHIEDLIQLSVGTDPKRHKVDTAIRWYEAKTNEKLSYMQLKREHMELRVSYERLKKLRAENGGPLPSDPPRALPPFRSNLCDNFEEFYAKFNSEGPSNDDGNHEREVSQSVLYNNEREVSQSFLYNCNISIYL